MEDKLRCQSCGMPLGEGFYGTKADGTVTQEYCKFCYQKGAFTEPDLTLNEMIAKSIKNMTEDLKMDPEKAEDLAVSLIPKLGRWGG